MVKYWARKGGLSTPVVSALPASDARLAQTPRTQAAADRLPARLCGMAPSADRHASPLIRRLAPGKGFPERKAALTAARSNTPAQCPRWVRLGSDIRSRVMSAFPLEADTSPHSGGVGLVPTADLPTTGVAQLIQKLFGRDQIGSAETLRKALVDRLEAGDGVGRAAPMT